MVGEMEGVAWKVYENATLGMKIGVVWQMLSRDLWGHVMALLGYGGS